MTPGTLQTHAKVDKDVIDENIELNNDLLQSLLVYVPADTSLDSIKVTLKTYDVLSSAKKIQEHGYRRIALQFPDVYLPFAPVVCAALSDLLDDDVLVFILGDTSYGACCADEVGAQHLDADAIIHYGDACLSPTRSLPVLYVFPGHAIEAHEKRVEEFGKAIRDVSCRASGCSRIVVLYDVELMHEMLSASSHIKSISTDLDIEVAQPRCGNLCEFIPPHDNEASSALPCDSGRNEENNNPMVEVGSLKFSTNNVPLEDTAVIWISSKHNSDEQPLPLRNAALQLANGLSGSCRGLYHYDGSGSVSNVQGWRQLRLRAREVSRFRDAQRIGVVAGTLAVSGANEAIDRVVSMIEDAGKRAYVLLVGKINYVKLLNFEEMEAFVVVACPLRTLMSSKDLPVPVVTPLEVETILSAECEIFEKPYFTDFRQMQPAVKEDPAIEEAANETSLVKRGNWSVTISGEAGAAAFYNDRAWKGLELSKGGRDEDTPLEKLSTDVVQGSCGIAQRYDREEKGEK